MILELTAPIVDDRTENLYVNTDNITYMFKTYLGTEIVFGKRTFTITVVETPEHIMEMIKDAS